MSKSSKNIGKIFARLLVAIVVIACIVFVSVKKSNEWPKYDGDLSASPLPMPSKPSKPSEEPVPVIPSPIPSLQPTAAQVTSVISPAPVPSQEPNPSTKVLPSVYPEPVNSQQIPLPEPSLLPSPSPSPLLSPPLSRGYSDNISADSIPEIEHDAEMLPGTGIGAVSFGKMINNGQFEEIENHLNGLIKADKKNSQALKQLGILYFHKGRFDEAVKIFQSALQKASSGKRPVRELGLIYTITDPPRGSQYFMTVLSGRTMEEKTAIATVESFLTLQAFRKKNRKDIQPRYLRLSSAIINRLLTYRVNRKEHSSDLSLMNAGILLLQGKTGEASKVYESVGLSLDSPGELRDKVHGAFARSIMYLNEGKLYEADRFITQANKLQKEYKGYDPELILPRQEQMIFCEVVLFRKGLLVFHLKQMWNERKVKLAKGVISIENSDRLRTLLIEMEESRVEDKYDTALKKAEEILKLLKKSGGGYFDLALVQPLFRSSLYIYMGDIFVQKKMKSEAGKCYRKAQEDFSPINKVVIDRIRKNGI